MIFSSPDRPARLHEKRKIEYIDLDLKKVRLHGVAMNENYARVPSFSLLALQQEFLSYQQQAQTAANRDPFTPQTKLICLQE